MVTYSFGNRNFMQPMGWLSMHSWLALVFSFWGVGRGLGGVPFCFSSLFNSAPAISPGQKWWPTVLKTKNTRSQWVGWSMHSQKFWVGVWGEGFFSFSFVRNMFPSSSQWVHTKFSMCSSRVFPIAPCVNSICFAQSPPPSHLHIGGPRKLIAKKKKLNFWGTPN